MLGRLRIDVDECISAYGSLVRAMHSGVSSQLGNTTLEAAVSDAVSRYARSSNERFHSAAENDCKVYVGFLCHDSRLDRFDMSSPPRILFSAAGDSRTTTCVRSYSIPDYVDASVTISEAVLAALTASTPLLGESASPHVALGGRALTAEMEKEATAIWCSRPTELTSLILCFVSVAAKEARKRRADDEPGEVVSLIPDERFFRLELDRMLVEDDLADDQRLAVIKAAADEYVAEQRTIMRHCALTLKEKQSLCSLFNFPAPFY